MAEGDPIHAVVGRWLSHLGHPSAEQLEAMVDEGCTFYSPIVYTPQEGRALTVMYLAAAAVALPGEPAEEGQAGGAAEGSSGGFRYTKQVLDGYTAVLEFETTVDGRYVNGVDIITCNDEGRITEFRVMVRPLQAVNAVHAQMKAQLERMQAS